MDTSNIKYIYGMFRYSGIEYVDFTVWDFHQNDDIRMAYVLNGTNNLKYFNISNYGNWVSASNAFYDEKCVEKIEINDNYSFSCSGLDTFDDSLMWYSPIKKQMYMFRNFDKNSYTYVGNMAGYYIRPMCTKDASFVAKYNPSKIKSKINVVDQEETNTFSVEVPDIKNVEYQDIVKIIVNPKDGYEVEDIDIIDEEQNKISYRKTSNMNEFEFTMPDTNVIIRPKYRKIDSSELINPNTKSQEIFVIIALIILGITAVIYSKKKRFNTNKM